MRLAICCFLAVCATSGLAAAAVGFQISECAPAPPPISACPAVIPIHALGEPFSIWVSAVDATGQRATDYTGTITFSSSDSSASLPPPFTFTAGDGGITLATVTFNTRGHLPGLVSGTNRQTVTVGDAANQISGFVAFTIRGVPVAIASPVPIVRGLSSLGLAIITGLIGLLVILRRGARVA